MKVSGPEPSPHGAVTGSGKEKMCGNYESIALLFFRGSALGSCLETRFFVIERVLQFQPCVSLILSTKKVCQTNTNEESRTLLSAVVAVDAPQPIVHAIRKIRNVLQITYPCSEQEVFMVNYNHDFI